MAVVEVGMKCPYPLNSKDVRGKLGFTLSLHAHSLSNVEGSPSSKRDLPVIVGKTMLTRRGYNYGPQDDPEIGF